MEGIVNSNADDRQPLRDAAKPPSQKRGSAHRQNPPPESAQPPIRDKAPAAASKPAGSAPTSAQPPGQPAPAQAPSASIAGRTFAPGSATPDPLSADRQLSAQRQAWVAKNRWFALLLAKVLGIGIVDIEGAAALVEEFIESAAQTDDPLERLLLQQVLMADYRLAALQCDAHEAKSPEHCRILNAAAVRLMAEIRRMALAIRQYRQPAAPRSFAVIHQQNIAPGANQQNVRFEDRSTAQEPNVSFSCAHRELGDNPHDQPIGPRFSRENEESPASGGGEDQRREAQTVGA